jgi:glutamate synthase domain-containing protein 3
MTGGRAVILGSTGKNFAAGMSGGIAYVYDEHNRLYRNLNKEMVLMEKVENRTDREELKRLLEKHADYAELFMEALIPKALGDDNLAEKLYIKMRETDTIFRHFIHTIVSEF